MTSMSRNQLFNDQSWFLGPWKGEIPGDFQDFQVFFWPNPRWYFRGKSPLNLKHDKVMTGYLRTNRTTKKILLIKILSGGKWVKSQVISRVSRSLFEIPGYFQVFQSPKNHANWMQVFSWMASYLRKSVLDIVCIDFWVPGYHSAPGMVERGCIILDTLDKKCLGNSITPSASQGILFW